MCGCAGSGFGGGGGGGGTGNLSGNLSAPKIPVATGLHALADTGADANSGLEYTEPLGAGHPLVNIKGLDGEMRVTGAGVGSGQRAPLYTGYASRGTIAAPTAIQEGDPLLAIKGQPYDGASFVDSGIGGLSVIAASDPDPKVATEVHLSTCGTDGIEADGLVIDQDQNTRIKETLVVEKASILGVVDLAIVAGNVAIDADASDFFQLDLTEDVTILAPSNPRIGRRFMLRIRTIGVAHTIAWNGVYVFLDSTPPTIDGTAQGYWYGGMVWCQANSRWHCVGPFIGPFLSE